MVDFIDISLEKLSNFTADNFCHIGGGPVNLARPILDEDHFILNLLKVDDHLRGVWRHITGNRIPGIDKRDLTSHKIIRFKISKAENHYGAVFATADK
ncbi:MAG: hypothetical protein R3293_17090 [Candidatus Promineifilaceae bacterium]|nr:hypothetical protein [Candidatus Promineifilaceae bacterium]